MNREVGRILLDAVVFDTAAKGESGEAKEVGGLGAVVFGSAEGLPDGGCFESGQVQVGFGEA